ncbi:hypothetical protein DFH11DRAFT_1727038 [Phellopilus nigrolimitatus]|nr:hypothetical protein DFH11DRAFT_1727038 [Phellopilus nigrolimitatus]
MSACQARQAETTQRKSFSRSAWWRDAAQADRTALLDLVEGRAIAKTNLVVDELHRDLAVHGATLQPKLLAVLDATFAAPTIADKVRDSFHQLADADGQRDRGALLALLA